MRREQNMKIRVGTLFSGVGAPEFALKNIGIEHEIAFACDISKYAKETYLHNHTCQHFFNDINDMINIDLPDIDLLVFGFPCQPFSVAGEMKGFKDVRGQLIYKAIDILRSKKPAYFIAENVAGLVQSEKGKTFKKVMSLMKRSGYKVEAKILDALDFGVPQMRKRVWFVGIRKDIKQKFIFPTGNGKISSLEKTLTKNVDKRYYATKSFLEKEKVIKKIENYNNNYIPCITHTISRNGSSSEYISYVAAVKKAIGEARKPTPMECAKLFGFPEYFSFAPKVSITQQYMQMGNTMVVTVLEEIFKNLFKEILIEEAI
jgi:DNA (cytosine-5)-methyltransferase 1